MRPDGSAYPWLQWLLFGESRPACVIDFQRQARSIRSDLLGKYFREAWKFAHELIALMKENFVRMVDQTGLIGGLVIMRVVNDPQLLNRAIC